MSVHARATLATFALLTVTGLDAQTPELSPCQQFLKKVEACVPHAPPELREVLQQSLQEMRATFTRIDKAQKQLLEQGKDLAKDVPNLLSEAHDAAEKMCAQLIKDTFSGSDCGALKPPM